MHRQFLLDAGQQQNVGWDKNILSAKYKKYKLWNL